MPQFSQTTAENYQNQLQSYQDKIDAQTAGQGGLDEATALAIQYYKFLDEAGIEYGGIAGEVIQGSTFYGRYANEMIRDALRGNNLEHPSSTIEYNREKLAIALVLEDATLRSQTTSGVLSSRQIANYHYSVFESNNLPREAWGGALYEEFVGAGSWMDVRNDGIEGIVDGAIKFTPSAFFGEYLQDKVVNGVSKNEAASRIIDTSSAFEGFDIKSSKTLTENLDSLKVNLGVLLNKSTQEPTQALLVAKDGDNLLLGNRDQHNTYYFPKLNGRNVITDPDYSGRIVIGDSSQSVELSGNAIPKKNPETGEIIEGQWSLNDYDLIRSGGNLIIVEAGGDVSSLETPGITISNFPFDSGRMNFGLILGVREITRGSIAGRPEYQGGNILLYNSGLRGPILIPDPDHNKRSEFYAVRQPSSSRTYFSKFDSYGRVIHDVNLGSATTLVMPYTYEADEERRITKTLLSFVTTSGGLGVVNFDVDSESIIASRIFATGKVQRIGTSISSVGAQNYFRYIKSTLNPVTQEYESEFINQPFNKDSLSNSGPEEIYSNSIAADRVFGKTSGSKPQIHEVLLPNGVTMNQAGYLSTGYIRINIPNTIDISSEKIPANLVINPGDNLQIPDNTQSLITTFQNAVSDKTAGQLKITPAPDSKLFIRGAENGRIDLSEFKLTPDEIAQRTTEVDSSSYTMEELLEGAYDPSHPKRRDVSMDDLIPKSKGQNLQIDEEELARPRRNVTANTTEIDELTKAALTGNAEKFTVLTLPARNSTMQLIFPGTGREEFLTKYPTFLEVEETSSTTKKSTARPLATTNQGNLHSSLTSNTNTPYLPEFSTTPTFSTTPAINGGGGNRINLSPGAGIGLIIGGAIVAAVAAGVSIWRRMRQPSTNRLTETVTLDKVEENSEENNETPERWNELTSEERNLDNRVTFQNPLFQENQDTPSASPKPSTYKLPTEQRSKGNQY